MVSLIQAEKVKRKNMDLNKLYANGDFVLPKSGKYLVEMWGRPVLKKKIKANQGTNHLLVFGLGWYSIPGGEFLVDSSDEEVLFIYNNGKIIDRLKHIGDNRWLGKLFWRDSNGKEIFLDYFFFTLIQ